MMVLAYRATQSGQALKTAKICDSTKQQYESASMQLPFRWKSLGVFAVVYTLAAVTWRKPTAGSTPNASQYRTNSTTSNRRS